jgi:hypothetical protein
MLRSSFRCVYRYCLPRSSGQAVRHVLTDAIDLDLDCHVPAAQQATLSAVAPQLMYIISGLTGPDISPYLIPSCSAVVRDMAG